MLERLDSPRSPAAPSKRPIRSRTAFSDRIESLRVQRITHNEHSWRSDFETWSSGPGRGRDWRSGPCEMIGRPGSPCSIRLTTKSRIFVEFFYAEASAVFMHQSLAQIVSLFDSQDWGWRRESNTGKSRRSSPIAAAGTDLPDDMPLSLPPDRTAP